MRLPHGYVQTGEIIFEATFRDDDWFPVFRAVQAQREIRLTTARGTTWPEDVRRGRIVDLEMVLGDELYRLRGRVRFRRLNVLVVSGQMERR